MSIIKIEKPKVFISYAWGTKEYQMKVLSLANDLVNDGIDVQIDKWSLKEGHDTYAFMEKCVDDSSITNVLLLLDKKYALKANSRSGGVGTETQIISPEIYNKTDQEKFIPIVFERGSDNEVYKPQYLKSLLHFDLSKSDKYEDEYQRLVRRLYGVEVFQKPELGKKPSWLEKIPTVKTNAISKYSTLKNNLPNNVKNEKFTLYLSDIKDRIINFKSKDELGVIDDNKYISIYMSTTTLRDEFLQLVRYISYVENGVEVIADTLEELCNTLKINNENLKGIKLSLLQEIFIYLVALLYKSNNLKGLAYILSKTYFSDFYSGCKPENFNIFYYNNERMNNAVNTRDNKNYYSGTAQLWIENINTDFCSKKEFVFADILCHNYSVFGLDYHYHWYWFPITYCYSGFDNSMFRTFSLKLKSSEHLSRVIKILGYDKAEKLGAKLADVKGKIASEQFKPYRFNSAFDTVPLLCYYIKDTELGTLK